MVFYQIYRQFQKICSKFHRNNIVQLKCQYIKILIKYKQLCEILFSLSACVCGIFLLYDSIDKTMKQTVNIFFEPARSGVFPRRANASIKMNMKQSKNLKT